MTKRELQAALDKLPPEVDDYLVELVVYDGWRDREYEADLREVEVHASSAYPEHARRLRLHG